MKTKFTGKGNKLNQYQFNNDSFHPPPVVDGAYYMEVAVPENKSARHEIYVIWQRKDSSETFYSASDVWFGDSPLRNRHLRPSARETIYRENAIVYYNNTNWRAKWMLSL